MKIKSLLLGAAMALAPLAGHAQNVELWMYPKGQQTGPQFVASYPNEISCDHALHSTPYDTSSVQAEWSPVCVPKNVPTPVRPVQAQALTQQWLSVTVDRTATEFDQELKAHGINGVGQQVDSCYNSAQENIDKWNIPVLRQCVLYDWAAYQFNQSMMRVFTMKGVDAHSIRYFMDEPFELRSKFYVPIAYGDISNNTLKGLGQAAALIVRVMTSRSTK